jgi:hypothetical protein
MRNEMQKLLQLTQALEKATDPDERDRLEEEIFNLEMEMEDYDDNQYRTNHHQKFSDF